MKFTRILKTEQLISSGVAPEAFATYCALSDYASNRNGLCWPRMDTIAAKIGRSVRTVQRHIHHLTSCGVIALVRRRRSKRGCYSSYLFRVVAVASFARKNNDSTTGHTRPAGKKRPIFRRTKRVNNPPVTSPRSEKDYEWMFALSPEQQKAADEKWKAHQMTLSDAL